MSKAIQTGNAIFLNRWTRSAINCYEIGCWCSKCRCIPRDMKQRCRLKSAVLENVRILGKPDTIPQFFEGLTKGENKIVKTILEGAENKKDISNNLKLHPSTVQVRINKLCDIAIKEGYHFKRGNKSLKELCEFLKSTCSLEKERIEQWILQD